MPKIYSNHRKKLFVIGAFIAASFLLQSSYHAIFQPSVAQAAPGINQTINFQGKLTNPNGSNVANDTYSVVFTLYTASSGGTALWTETQNVTTSTGLFRVSLGSVNSLASVDFNQDNLYLGIKVGADAEMTPRIRFTASPYAFNAQKVNGLNVSGDSGGLAFFTANGITTDSSLVWDNTNKRLGIGTAPTAALDVDGSAAISGELLVAGDLVLGGTTAANGSFHMDVSAGLLTLGTDGSIDGGLRFASTSSGLFASITTDSFGNLQLSAAEGAEVVIGTGSGGDIHLDLLTVDDVLYINKNVALSAGTTAIDTLFQRDMTGGSFNIGGTVVKIEDISSTSGVNTATMLHVHANPAGGTFTGDLLNLQNGANTRLIVKGDGRIGVNGGVDATAALRVTGDMVVSTDGSSQSTPRTLGFSDFDGAEAARFQFGDPYNALQNAYGGTMDLYAYHTIRLVGDRNNSSTGLDFSTISNIGVLVQNTVGSTDALVVQGASGQTADLQQWRNSTGTVLAALDNEGNLGLGIDPTAKLHVDGTLLATGAITFSNYTTNGGVLYTNGSGQLQQLGTGLAGQCLQSTGSGSPVWGDCVLSSPANWAPAEAAVANSWYGLTYGDEKFVAVSTNGTDDRVMVSSDGGETWSDHAPSNNNAWRDVVYAQGKFVAVASSGTVKVMTSTDGQSWTGYTPPDQNWRSVTYGNGLFVAVSDDGATSRVMTSTDGEVWNLTTTSPTSSSWRSVAYGNGRFVAVADSGSHRSMTSTDGINWTSNPTGTSSTSLREVVYGDGKFVAVTSDGSSNVVVSTDGVNWLEYAPASASFWNSVAYGNGYFVAVAQSGAQRIMYSTDAQNWVGVTAPEDNTWETVAYGGSRFVAVASDGTNRVMHTVSDTSGGGGSGGSSLFTDSGTFTYLSSSTDDLVLGGTTTANGTFHMDVSEGLLSLGTDGALNGGLRLYSTTNGVYASISVDASGNLVLSAGDGGSVVVGSDAGGDIVLELLNPTDVLKVQDSLGGELMILDEDGNMALGASSATTRLDVNGLIRVRNPQGETTAPTRSNNGEFAFAEVGSTGRLYARINGNNVYFNSDASGDYSEYFEKADYAEDFAVGHLVTLDSGKASKATQSSHVVGIVSAFGTRNNDDGGDGMRHTDPRYVNVGLLGQLPVIVTNEHGPIVAGDRVGTSANYRGVGVKATQSAGSARAMSSFIPASSCTPVNSVGNIVWPNEVREFNAAEGMCWVLPNGVKVGRVMAYMASSTAHTGASTASVNTQAIDTLLSTFTIGNGTVTANASLKVAGDLTAQGGLVVIGDAEFRGPAIFKALAEFIDTVVFRKDVKFEGTPIFNQDTAGLATILPGQNSVRVEYEKAYAQQPVVNTSLNDTPMTTAMYESYRQADICTIEEGPQGCQDKLRSELLSNEIRFIITNQSATGFTVVLAEPATQQLTFSWSALAVADARNVVNEPEID